MVVSGLEEFHFLRPAWLLLVLALVPMWLLLRSPSGSLDAWRRVCDEHLLGYLTAGQDGRVSSWPVALLIVGWLAACLALAGPVWQKRDLPLFKTIESRVIVLDLSRSMLATDLKPNRLEQARFKLSDLLDRVDEGQIGLVAYAGEAFVVSPLTDDANTIKAMLGALDPGIMPVQGSELDEALELAGKLLERGAGGNGEVLLISDAPGVGAEEATRRLVEQGFTLSVLGIGTPEGAPIPTRGGGFYKGRDGSIVIPGLDEAGLRKLAERSGGRYARMTADGSDLDLLLQPMDEDQGRTESADQTAEQWREEGPWLVLFLLPLAALSFRRGWLGAVFIVALVPIDPANALGWSDLWQRKDQQAQELLSDGDPARAAELAEDPLLRGEGHYRNADYRAAQSAFSAVDTADGHYNLGNALARQNRLEEAIAAYDQALSREPEMADALYNKQLLEELLKQQQEQEQQQQGEDGEPQENEDQQGAEGEDSEPGEDESQEGEQQQGEEQQGEQQEGEGQDQQVEDADELTPEERQAVEQWLRRIPDDPGGLLRRKFLLQYQRRGSPQPASDEDW
jgi:Ca-activated chloride channel family protein